MSNHQPHWLPPALTIAFATAVTMWIAGFLTHIPGIALPAPATGSLLIAIQALGALALGRAAPPARLIPTGIAGGLATGAVNLLILGALLVNDAEPDRNPALLAAAYLAASTIIGALGAAIGRAILPTPRRTATTRDWLGLFAITTVLAAIPVLFSGAVVTSAQAGLAVRDWPATYGSLMWLYPLSKMTGGIYYEHAHRLFGSLVGLSTIVLLLFALAAEPRKLVKTLTLLAFLLVLAQGILGGIRVTAAVPTESTPQTNTAPADPVPLDYAQTADTAKSKLLAMTHGISGQVTLAFLCIIAALTGRRWRSLPPDHPREPDRFLRIASAFLLATLLIQVALGALTRHFESGHAMMTHLAFATVVALAAAAAGLRTTRYTKEHAPLKVLGVHAFAFVVIQIVLGFVTMFAVMHTYADDFSGPEPTSALIIATLHQFIGAAFLATAALLLLWTRRLTTGAATPRAIDPMTSHA